VTTAPGPTNGGATGRNGQTGRGRGPGTTPTQGTGTIPGDEMGGNADRRPYDPNTVTGTAQPRAGATTNADTLGSGPNTIDPSTAVGTAQIAALRARRRGQAGSMSLLNGLNVREQAGVTGRTRPRTLVGA